MALTDPRWRAPRTPGEILVRLLPGHDKMAVAALCARFSHSVADPNTLSDIGYVIVRGDDTHTETLAGQLLDANHADVAEPNCLQDAFSVTPNDPLFSLQWDKTIMGCPAAWSQQEGGAAVVIAVGGSGIDPTHPDLVANLISPGINVVDGSTDTSDVLGHETKVAGVIGAVANNSAGIAGGAFNCPILPIRMTDATGATNATYHAAMFNAAANWAVTNNKKVIINDSWGSTTFQQTIQDAVNYAWGKGLVIFASGANAPASNTPIYPAAMTNVIGVGASNQSDVLASYSSYGPWVDVFAPGGEPAGTLIETTFNGGTYGGAAGCSVATPNAVAAAALAWMSNTSYLNSDISGFVTGNCDSLPAAPDGSAVKRVNVNSSVTAAKNGSPTVPPVGDTPAVTITNPATGTLITQTVVSITASATSNLRITGMTISVDGKQVGSSTASPCVASWNTRHVRSGTHTITATATNGTHTGTATPITVTK